MKKILDFIKTKKKTFKIIGLTTWALITFAFIITINDLVNTPHCNTIINNSDFRITLIDTDNNGYYDTIDIIESQDRDNKINFKLVTTNGICLFEGELNEDILHIHDKLSKEYKVNEGDIENSYADLVLNVDYYYNKYSKRGLDNTYKIQVFKDCSYILDYKF